MSSKPEAVKEPRGRKYIQPKMKSLDYSFLKLMFFHDLTHEIPRNSNEKTPGEKNHASIIKLNNNSFEDLKNFTDSLAAVIFRPETLTWIDLSFNFLTSIGTVFTSFPVLQILLLHGNKISDPQEVRNLANCHALMKLTLHGNPIETTKYYRFYVLSILPWLKNLDMSTVTHMDLTTSKALFYKRS